MRVPLRKGRRATTLPTPTSPIEMRGLVNFAESMKRELAAANSDIRRSMNREVWSAAFEPDPWDEAIKSIERRKAADAEWPWPKRAKS